jgi:hypothetical protein
MPTEPTPTTPLAGDAGNAPQTPGGSPTTPPEPLAGDGQEQISLDEARKLRKENQTLRNRQKTIDEAEAAKQQAALSEVDKATKRATEAEAKIQAIQKQLVTAHVKMAAQARNIIDPDLAAMAIADSLEYGDDGMPINLDKALDTLIKNKPYLLAATSAAPANPAQTNGTPALPAMNPGRSSIPSPTGNIPGVRHRLSEFL